MTAQHKSIGHQLSYVEREMEWLVILDFPMLRKRIDHKQTTTNHCETLRGNAGHLNALVWSTFHPRPGQDQLDGVC